MISGNYLIKSINDDIGKFTITLTSDQGKHNVRVIFHESIDISRGTKLSYRKDALDELIRRYGKKFFSEWPFFKVTNSAFIQWLSNESHELVGYTDGLTHFVFLGSNYIVDVIEGYEPKIEVFD